MTLERSLSVPFITFGRGVRLMLHVALAVATLILLGVNLIIVPVIFFFEARFGCFFLRVIQVSCNVRIKLVKKI